MSNKTLAILSYITIIGALIAYINGRKKKDPFFRYHLNQGLGLGLMMGFYISSNQFFFWNLFPNPEIYRILDWGNLFFLIWAIIGIGNVIKHRTRPLPLIGGYFVNTVKIS